jgi:hypothetical protein
VFFLGYLPRRRLGDLGITVRGNPPGKAPWIPHSSLKPQPVELPDECAGPSVVDRPAVSFGAPPEDRMSIAASEGELGSGDDDSTALPPSGRTALPEPDPEMAAMLKKAAKAVGLEWNPPPCPEPSRLDYWYLGAGRSGSQPAALVPFFPEVHEELTRAWMAPFSARNHLSSLTTLDGGAVKGYEAIPPVEQSVAMQHILPQAVQLFGTTSGPLS